jgi:RNase adapter protein RapZ
VILDTSSITPHDLRERIRSHFLAPEDAEHKVQLSIVSFGYKYGLPIDADLVFDTRFLPNPHWVPELRPFPGTDERVRDYVLNRDEARAYLTRICDMLESLLPAFAREGKHYVTVAIGCTGGRHRSVVFTEEITRALKDAGYPARLIHRDLDRE